MAEAMPSAKSVLDKISQGHLECPICHCRFADPRMLDCLHSFCLVCLKELGSKQQPKPDQITCPVCRRKTAVPENGFKGLKRAFFLSSLVDEFKIHERLLGRESGKTATSQESDTGEVVRFTFPKLPGNDFPITSRILRRSNSKFKSRAMSVKHSSTVTDNPPRPSFSRFEIAEGGLDIEKGSLQFQSVSDSIEDTRNRLRVMVIEACQDITDKEEEEISKMRKKYEMLREEVTQIGKDRGNRFAKTLHINRKKIKERKKVEEKVTKLKDLIEQGPDQEMLEVNQNMMPILGSRNLEFEGVQHDLSFIGVKCHDIVDSIKRVGEVIQQEKWRFKGEFCLKGPGLGGRESRFSGVACFRSGDTAVVDTGKKSVFVFSSGELYKTEIGARTWAGEGRLTDPWGVAVSNDDHLLVADEREVKLYDSDFKYISKFAPWQVDLNAAGEEITESALTGVAVDKKNRMVVADAGRQCVSTHDLLSGSLISKFHITDGANIGLAISNKERLVFTEYDRQKVVCTTIEGRELFSFTPTFAGIAWKPFGVCCDAAGDIYLSVHCPGPRRTGEIHHYDPSGVHVGCVARGLYNPLGITFAPSGDLVVADLLSIKVFHRV